jgi:GntR family transcriptional regulator / MocR family aminotransferase
VPRPGTLDIHDFPPPIDEPVLATADSARRFVLQLQIRHAGNGADHLAQDAPTSARNGSGSSIHGRCPLRSKRRLRLLHLARRRRFAVIEDCDHEFHFEGAPLLPLASMDAGGTVVYIGTLSKILAPGLRLGFLVSPPPVVDALAAQRAGIDRQGDAALELAIAELLEDGEIERHIGRARRVYRARREVLIAELAAAFGNELNIRVPRGGLALWAAVDPKIDVDAWARRALSAGVWFPTGRSFHVRGAPVAGLRLGFAALEEHLLREAVRRMAAVW